MTHDSGTYSHSSTSEKALPLETPLVLVVDDEPSIRKTLEEVFSDEGMRVLGAEDGPSALALLAMATPQLVLLDIWMPGMDGLEVLSRIRELYPDLPVIMISGHASIATAIKATKMGATDFIEKPLDLNATLSAVRRVLSSESPQSSPPPSQNIPSDPELWERSSLDLSTLNNIAFTPTPWEGKAFPQKTLAQSAVLYGQGLHSGRKSGLILEPLPENSGIHFAGVSEATLVPAHVDFVDSTGYATTVKLGGTQAGTIEHIMSALHAYGISNLLIKCNSEVPVLDGSSREFCALFEQVGVVEQSAEWREIAVAHTVRVGNEREFIQIEPSDSFTIHYTLNYPEPVGTQELEFTLDSVETYKEQIAPARTFGFVKDIGWLQKQGLALGGRFDNFVLFGDKGSINDSLRFPDEPVRHKILDAIGDLFLLGRRLRGRVTAKMTGHSDNIALLKALKNEYLKKAF